MISTPRALEKINWGGDAEEALIADQRERDLLRRELGVLPAARAGYLVMSTKDGVAWPPMR